MSPWASGDSLSPTNLNTKMSSAITSSIPSYFSTNLGWFNVKDYGAIGNNVADDTASIMSAVRAAEVVGGIVYFPGGTYRLTSSLTLAASTNTGIHFWGQGMRDTYLRPDASCKTAIVLGDIDNSTSYYGMRDMSITGGNVSAHTGCAIHWLRPQKCEMRNVIIEEFDGDGGAGFYLQGDDTAVAPHAWRCLIENVLVATTRRPLVMVNADENDFVSCNFGLPAAMTSRVTALELRQGKNNRFFGTLLSGIPADLTNRVNYVGLNLAQPTIGENQSNQFYGLVAEGFDAGIWIDSGTSQQIIMGYNGSINSSHLSIGASAASITVLAPLHGTHLWSSGFSTNPAFSFSEESRLGFFRSAASFVYLSYGTLGTENVSADQRFVSRYPIQSLAANKFFSFSDYNMGFRRSVNSATMRFTGPTGSDATFYVETPIRTGAFFGESGGTFTQEIFSGVGGTNGGYAFTFSGSGMQQVSSGSITFGTNTAPANTFLGTSSTGSVFLGATGIGAARARIQLNGTMSVLTTGTSVTSSNLSPCGIAFFIGGASGASIAINSGGTIYFFSSSASTVG